MPLREYQSRCIADARRKYAEGSRAICVVCPTGGGKTMIAAAIAETARVPVLVIVHRIELADQARDKFPPGTRIETIQGLLASGQRPEAGIVITDEAHHFSGPAYWSTIGEHYRSRALLVGLTATPERADGAPLGDLFTSMVVAASYSELLAGGWIVPCDVFAPDRRDSTLACPPAEAVRTYSGNRQTIVFCSTVNEARECAAALPLAACVDGETPGEIRADFVAAFRSGTLRTLTSVYVLSEGFDAPEAAVCILARNFGHASGFLQAVGRVLRPAPGKRVATLVDLCGSSLEHGWPTEDRDYSLDGSAIRRRGEAKPVVFQCKNCGMCFTAYPPNRMCPSCGHRIPEPEALKIARRRLAQQERNARAPTSERQRAWLALQAEARAKGYKIGWAFFRFRGRFGSDPPHGA